MSYSIHELATRARISVRTLHHYDAIGLLQPKRDASQGYRLYSSEDVQRLQDILLFRALDFSLSDIRSILASPRYSREQVLRDQRHLLRMRRNRLQKLIRVIDTMLIHSLHSSMQDDDLYSALSDEEERAYAEEAKQRWGHTQMYQESQKRYARMSKEDLKAIQKEQHELLLALVAAMPLGVESEPVQLCIARHFDGLRHWYEPTLDLYEGLAKMYVDDPRFSGFYEKYSPGLASFLSKAMLYYVHQHRTSKNS